MFRRCISAKTYYPKFSSFLIHFMKSNNHTSTASRSDGTRGIVGASRWLSPFQRHEHALPENPFILSPILQRNDADDELLSRPTDVMLVDNPTHHRPLDFEDDASPYDDSIYENTDDVSSPLPSSPLSSRGPSPFPVESDKEPDKPEPEPTENQSNVSSFFAQSIFLEWTSKSATLISPWYEWVRNLFILPNFSSTPSASSSASKSSPFEGVEGDIVVLGGYYGSCLKNTQTEKPIWLALEDFLTWRAPHVRRLVIPFDVPSGTLDNHEATSILERVGPVDVCSQLMKALYEREKVSEGKVRVHPFAYDWRKELHLSRDTFLEHMQRIYAQNGNIPITVIAHSMGGLIVLSAVNKAPHLFKGVVFIGIPFGPVPMILWAMRRGAPLLLSRDLMTAKFTFATRSSFIFLPRDKKAFVDVNGKDIPIDFLKAEEWSKYALAQVFHRCDSESEYQVLMKYLRMMLSHTKSFHESLKFQSELKNKYPSFVTIVSERWPTPTSFRAATKPCSRRSPVSNVTNNPDNLSMTDLHLENDNNVEPKSERQTGRVPLHHQFKSMFLSSFPNSLSQTSVTANSFYIHSNHTHDLSLSYPLFGPGDGVVPSSSQAMPPGYTYTTLKSSKNHVSMMNDIKMVSEAITSISRPSGS